jgi:hypothetical protein
MILAMRGSKFHLAARRVRLACAPSMTRFSIALVVVSAFAICACERHPLPGQPVVTHTHGSNGDHHEEHPAGKHPEEKKEVEKKTGEGAAKAEDAKAKTGEGEEKPKFFPEEKK